MKKAINNILINNEIGKTNLDFFNDMDRKFLKRIQSCINLNNILHTMDIILDSCQRNFDLNTDVEHDDTYEINGQHTFFNHNMLGTIAFNQRVKQHGILFGSFVTTEIDSEGLVIPVLKLKVVVLDVNNGLYLDTWNFLLINEQDGITDNLYSQPTMNYLHYQLGMRFYN